MISFNLNQYELTVSDIHRNPPPSALYEHAILCEKDAHIAQNGALVAYSGVKTGRSPKDKRVAKQSPSENEVWWGPVNIPLDPHAFAINRERARDYLNTRERLYCFDGFAGWDPNYRLKVRVICSRGPITPSSSTPCSSGPPRRNWKGSARPTSSSTTRALSRPTASPRAWAPKRAST